MTSCKPVSFSRRTLQDGVSKEYCGLGIDVHVCFVGTELCCDLVVVA